MPRHARSKRARAQRMRERLLLIKIVSDPSRAPSMSDGAQFIPKVEGSKWEVEISDDNGARTMRLIECPRGYALERKQNNPQADRCVECPGSSNAAYSLREARWLGDESLTGVDMWCEPCPNPAGSVNCAGDNLVTGKEGWWLVEEEEPIEGQDSRRDYPAMKHVFRSTGLPSPSILSLPFSSPGHPFCPSLGHLALLLRHCVCWQDLQVRSGGVYGQQQLRQWAQRSGVRELSW